MHGLFLNRKDNLKILRAIASGGDIKVLILFPSLLLMLLI